MKRNYYSSLHEKLDRILELLEEEEKEFDVLKFPFNSPEPIPPMESMEPEGRNIIENGFRIETHEWNSPNNKI